VGDNTHTLELLCGHHSLDRFDSGLAAYDHIARSFHKRVVNLDSHDFMAVAATAGSTEISGLVAVTEARLPFDDPETGTVITGRWVVYQLLVVGREHQHTDLVHRLRAKLEDMGRVRLRGNLEIVGEAVSPVVWRPAYHIGLTGYLRRNGFHEDPLGWWFRPRRPADQ
jgi:hypothetical protein